MTSRPPRLGFVLVVVGAAALAVAALGAILLATDGRSSDGGSSADRAATPRALVGILAQAGPAAAPFTGLTATELRVGERTLAVVVADSTTERGEGLRRRRDLGSYDGMLFVFPEDSSAGFTMSTVPVALDIGFYDAAGRRVSKLRMRPCSGSEADCPTYRAGGSYRYALETLAGDLPAGALG